MAFRVDASTTVGGGHAHRCLALAHALCQHGARCLFIVRAGSTQTVPALLSHDTIELDSDLDELAVPRQLAAAMPQGVDWLVVDSYGLDARFEVACRPWARRLAAIDDLAARPHEVDLLIDQTPGRIEADYAGLLADGCHCLLGAQHALLRPEFARLRPSALARREATDALERVVVSFGAADPHNHAAKALALLGAAGLDCRVVVILGSQSTNGSAVRKMAAGCPFVVDVFDAVDDMAEHLAHADLAIGGGGVAALERCCLGLPTLLVILADNQRSNANYLAETGAAWTLDNPSAMNSPAAVAALLTLAQDAQARRRMSMAAAKLSDGHGAMRVAAKMLEMTL